MLYITGNVKECRNHCMLALGKHFLLILKMDFGKKITSQKLFSIGRFFTQIILQIAQIVHTLLELFRKVQLENELLYLFHRLQCTDYIHMYIGTQKGA